jgi:hypothetical protein
VAWAVNLCIDLMLIFSKFGRAGVERDLHPRNLDPRQLRALFDEHATDVQFQGRVARIFGESNLWPNQPGKTAEDLVLRAADWDEFAAAHITSPEQIADVFSRQLYFGCESDDPTVRWAFDDRASMGARFQPIFSSNISHFDVTDMTVGAGGGVRARRARAHRRIRLPQADVHEYRGAPRPNEP